MKLLITILTILLLAFSPDALGSGAKVTVAIQPLGQFDQQLLAEVETRIKAEFLVDIVRLPERALPQAAFYPPRARYRAEKLATFLNEIDQTSSKVIGLTTKDISTTKGEFVDWGIFGFAFLGKRSCVVSTHRLGGKGASKALQLERLSKVVVHELGHTFGLDHCPNQGCTMEDARGTIRVVDKYTGFCQQCQQRLRAANLIK